MELRYGLNPALPDAAVDSDQDGFTNYQEFIARLDPMDANSVLRLDTILGPSGPRLGFAAQADMGYTIQVKSRWGPVLGGLPAG